MILLSGSVDELPSNVIVLAGSIIVRSGPALATGGCVSSDDHTSRVDIYDASSNTWSIAELSEPRINPAAAAAGSKIFFAGGCGGVAPQFSQEYSFLHDM